MAQQDLDWLKGELQRVEQKIEDQQAKIIAATKAKELPEVIALVKEMRDRLVEKEKDFRHQLMSAMQTRLTSSAGLTKKEEAQRMRDNRRTVAVGVLEKLQDSTFIIKANNDDTSGLGVGIFIGPNLAVTADHVVDEVDDPTEIHAWLPDRNEELMLMSKFRDKKLDYALLSSPVEHPHVDVWEGNFAELAGEHLALCTYLLGLEDELAERFEPGIAILPARGLKLSRNQHFLVYQSETWPGDSGGALLMHDGHLVGIHTEGINHLQELQRMELDDTTGRIEALEASVNEAIRSLATGCIAVLATAFKLS